MCATSGKTITLPIVGSVVTLRTNGVGGQYRDNENCAVILQHFLEDVEYTITLQSFNTEGGYDFLTIYNAAGGTLYRQSGNPTTPATKYATNYLRITFTSDHSNVGTGVIMMITAKEPLSISATTSSMGNTGSSGGSGDPPPPPPDPSQTQTPTQTPTASNTPTPTSTESLTSSASSSASTSSSSSASSSYGSESPSDSLSPSASDSTSSSPSVSSTPTSAQSASITQSLLSTQSSCTTRSQWSTRSALQSFSRSSRVSYSSSKSAYPTLAPKGPPPPLPDLTNVSLGQLNYLFNDLSSYDPALIKGALHKLGSAGLKQSNGSFAVSTSSFDLTMASLSKVSNMVLPGSTSVSMPTTVTAEAASAIQWASSPYNLSTDTSVLSITLLDTGGSEIPANNLSQPIVFSWNLNTSDPRFMPTPTYLARCDKDIVFLQKGETYTEFYGANHTGKGSWIVPCMLDIQKPLICTSFEPYTFKSYTCPSAVLSPSCIYWDSIAANWSTAGCTSFINGSVITCFCTHLTDFSTRISAIGEENTEIFNNAGNVYSAEGLVKYAQWYSIFGGIALVAIILGGIVSSVDYRMTVEYVISLQKNKYIQSILKTVPMIPLHRYNRRTVYKDSLHVSSSRDPPVKITSISSEKEDVPVPVIQGLHLWSRILLQHNRLQFIFRYDPRLSRLFRMLSVFVIQFHSLFVTALLYGFTYTQGSSMMWYDTIALAVITSLLNIPVIRMMFSYMNRIGMEEFKYQFPLLTYEYERRAEFEKYALLYIHKKGDESDESGVDIEELGLAGDDDTILANILGYLCCRKKVEEEEAHAFDKNILLQKMIKLVKSPYPTFTQYPSYWSKVPCHTVRGWIFIFASFGWLGWCLNYLLLFASAHQSHTSTSILTSYATSEITTVFLSQPIAICISSGLVYLLHKYGSRLPAWTHKFTIISHVKKIHPLYYFSNPWASTTRSAFTAELAYTIFVKCPAIVAGVEEQAYAPIKAIIPEKEVDKDPISDQITKLYEDVLKVKNIW